MSTWNFDGEARVAVVGDLHGNARWAGKVIPAIGRLAADVESIVQVGDLGIAKDDAFLKAVDYWCSRANVDRVIVTLGNHEYCFSPAREALSYTAAPSGGPPIGRTSPTATEFRTSAILRRRSGYKPELTSRRSRIGSDTQTPRSRCASTCTGWGATAIAPA